MHALYIFGMELGELYGFYNFRRTERRPNPGYHTLRFIYVSALTTLPASSQIPIHILSLTHLHAHGGFIPTCSSGSQNTTSLSAVAHMLYLGFHSTTLARPLHGKPHMGLISLVSTSTWPCVSHTIASRSPPLPPTRYLPSALKQTSPWPRAPGFPGAARRLAGVWERLQWARRVPSKASRRR